MKTKLKIGVMWRNLFSLKMALARHEKLKAAAWLTMEKPGAEPAAKNNFSENNETSLNLKISAEKSYVKTNEMKPIQLCHVAGSKLCDGSKKT